MYILNMQSFRHINNKPALDQLFLVLPSVQYFCVPWYLCIIYFFVSSNQSWDQKRALGTLAFCSNIAGWYPCSWNKSNRRVNNCKRLAHSFPKCAFNFTHVQCYHIRNIYNVIHVWHSCFAAKNKASGSENGLWGGKEKFGRGKKRQT